VPVAQWEVDSEVRVSWLNFRLPVAEWKQTVSSLARFSEWVGTKGPNLKGIFRVGH
jgi:hypothetical protein